MTDLLSALPTTRITISLTVDEMEMLTWRAEGHGVPVSSVLYEAISIYLLSVRPLYRLAHKQEAT